MLGAAVAHGASPCCSGPLRYLPGKKCRKTYLSLCPGPAPCSVPWELQPPARWAVPAPGTTFQLGFPSPDQKISCGSVLVPWSWGMMEDGEALAALGVQPNLHPLSFAAGPKARRLPAHIPALPQRAQVLIFTVKSKHPLPQPSQCPPPCTPWANPESHPHFSAKPLFQAHINRGISYNRVLPAWLDGVVLGEDGYQGRFIPVVRLLNCIK